MIARGEAEEFMQEGVRMLNFRTTTVGSKDGHIDSADVVKATHARFYSVQKSHAYTDAYTPPQCFTESGRLL